MLIQSNIYICLEYEQPVNLEHTVLTVASTVVSSVSKIQVMKGHVIILMELVYLAV